MQQNSQVQGWHVANWGTWGWIETGIKLAGIIAGILAFISSSGDLVTGGNPRLAAVILVGLLSLALLGALFMRMGQKEVISLLFAIANVVGHVGVLIALLRVPADLTLPILFGVLFVLGELAKQVFLVTSGYTEAGQNTRSMRLLSGGLAVVYALFVVFLLV